jgi:predicted amidophosphoribosyltransferase
MRWAVLLEKVRGALQSPICWQCGEKPVSRPQLFCKRCREWLSLRTPAPLLEVGSGRNCHAATTFNSSVKKLIYGYKFYGESHFGSCLAGLLIDYWSQMPPAMATGKCHPESVMVVPIPPRTGQKSHLESYASRFARHFGYDFCPDGLRWTREVEPQHILHERGLRLKNIAASLTVGQEVLGRYAKVLLIDDLTTTGATLQEACRALAECQDMENILALAVSQVPRSKLFEQPAE